MFSALLSKLGVGALLGALPKQVWLSLGVALLLVLGVVWHSGKVRSAKEEAYTQGLRQADQEWSRRLELMREEAHQWRQQAEEAQARAAEQEKLRHAADLVAGADRAIALRMLGSGKANTCSRDERGSQVSSAPSRPGPAKPTDAAGAGVPAAGRDALVPWGWLVDRAEQCDQYRSEIQAWRNWYNEQVRLNKQLRDRGSVTGGGTN